MMEHHRRLIPPCYLSCNLDVSCQAAPVGHHQVALKQQQGMQLPKLSAARLFAAFSTDRRRCLLSVATGSMY
jgi:hypothetical protein